MHLPTRTSGASEVLSRAEWTAARRRHRRKLRPVLAPYLERRGRGRKDPVMDFLFEYYSFRPSALRTWSPGVGVFLEEFDRDPAEPAASEDEGRSPADPARADLPDVDLFRVDDRGRATLDVDRFPTHRLDAAHWILDLLRRTRTNEPFFGCHGLHEWAMIYRADRVRHEDVPLRLTEEKRERVVEDQVVSCSHFDAYRFFTEEARPLNRTRPTHETMPAREQPGCLHTNMDCYRWAFKFHPWIPGSVVADAFLSACRIRVVDMRASPYDLSAFGLAPIRVETEAGRREYRRLQRKMDREVAPLRDRLIDAYERMLEAVETG